METKVIREERYQTNKLIKVLEDLEELSNHLGFKLSVEKEKQKNEFLKILISMRDSFDKMLDESNE